MSIRNFLVLGLLTAAASFGGTFTIASGDNSGNGNLVTDPNQTRSAVNVSSGDGSSAAAKAYNIAPNSAWATITMAGTVANGTTQCGEDATQRAALQNCAKWISHDDTQVPNPQIANGSFVEFVHTFNIVDPTVVSANLIVLADDRADIRIYNGSNTNTFNFVSPIGSNGPCNLAVIGCVAQWAGSFNIASALSQGTNRIVIKAYQSNGSGFGASYLATITTVPEPGFYYSLAVGFAGLGVAIRRRKLKK